jgi:hypothetical protein
VGTDRDKDKDTERKAGLASLLGPDKGRDSSYQSD